MFATLTEKLIVGLLALLVVVGTVMWLEHRGAQRCEAGDQSLQAAAAVRNARIEAAGTIAGNTEDRHREDALARPVDPVPAIRVQPAAHPACRNAAPAARPAAAEGPPAEPVRAAGEGSGVPAQGDAGDALWVGPVSEFVDRAVRLARDADVEIADRDRLLIVRDAVCRGQMQP